MQPEQSELLIVAETCGFGHVMRCLALAQECRSRGWRIFFIGNYSGYLYDRCRMIGKIRRRYYPDPSIAWVVVDSYNAGKQLVQSYQQQGYRVLYIDDLGIDTGAELTLNYHGQQTYAGKAILGWEHLLLRTEYRKYHSLTRTSGPVQNILVALGGQAPLALTHEVVNGLIYSRQYLVTVTGLERGQRHWQNYGVRVYQQVYDMARLMAGMDVCITTASVGAYEAAYMGLPMGLFKVADNQTVVMESLKDITIPLRDTEDIYDLLGDQSLRMDLSQRCINSFDAYGSQRVLAEMEKISVAR